MKTMYYSPSTNGFYDEFIHVVMPKDVVSITVDRYNELLDGQAAGKFIRVDIDGKPILVDPPPITPEQIAETVAAARAAAFRNESDPLFFKAQRGEATMDEWLAKVAEIKARYPDGVLPTV